MRIRPLQIVTLTFILATACAQRTSPKYEPNEVQKLQLQVAQKDAIIAKQAKDVADQNFNKAYATLQGTASDVILKNKWPADLQFDVEKLVFFEKPALPASTSKAPAK